jgi:hemimethylated DNA binding protein
MTPLPAARFTIGQVVKHRLFPFRGVIFDVDPVFNNTEDWWLSIPEEIRPRKDQPFYHLLAENDDTEYVAYVIPRYGSTSKASTPSARATGLAAASVISASTATARSGQQ